MPKARIKKIRLYQSQCVDACDHLVGVGGSMGKVILPTGSGKTVIGQEVIMNLVKSQNTSIAVVYVPRIILGKQWVARTAMGLIRDSGLKIAFIVVNSGGISNKIRKEIEEAQYDISGPGSPKIAVTTNPTEIRNEVSKLNRLGYHVVILSTYHSSKSILSSGIEVDLSLFDECQYLVSSSEEETEFMFSMEVPSKRKIFLTATPRLTDSEDGFGMNNENRFGEVVFEKKPREIIDAGAIVGPKIHIIGCDSVLDSKDHNKRIDMLLEAFVFHKKQIKKASFHPDRIGAKMLVACDGQTSLIGLFSSRRFKEIREEYPDIKIYGLSSDFGCYINGTHYSPPVSGNVKELLLETFDELNENDDAIIFHVDMIAEGLDVPGMTGFLPLRSGLGKIKFLQNLGRTTRLHPGDASRIFNTDELKIGDHPNYIKPHCYVIIPYLVENRDDFLDRNATLIDGMRTEYGFDASDTIICDITQPMTEGPLFDEDALNKEIRSKVSKDIERFYHQIEEESLAVDTIVNMNKMRRFTPEQIQKFVLKACSV